ncbi:hypothetical protein KXD40_006577 [Peronospora effusa]|uniref:L-dopachrome isomerase n=1 Tax=Peronospora effusa TaxID=542832 RepID=A0A3M6VR56_9STRA|nr:hypothetical protein DD238_002876 [Peronospora effusa]RQM09872.1 hypothetical protein DD237_002097 [Peronospora effusa]UIZ25060.1 hypothetical protein KXD40_006577 [Peronospora effusa]CAI5719864.1 unnamed protein product [Peronospora effusa]
MPYVQVTSNVSSNGIKEVNVMATISKTLAHALDKSEQVVMVHLELDTFMYFQATHAPCAMIHVRSIGKVDMHFNPTTASALTETVSKELQIPVDRIFMNIDDVQRSNWAKGGVLIPEPKAMNDVTIE